MEIKKTVKAACDKMKKYKHAVLVILIGLFMMTAPSFLKKNAPSIDQTIQTQPLPNPEETLEQLLSCLCGAGEVRVMLSIETGEKIIYQTDKDSSSTGETNSLREDTVTINDGNRNESGLISQIIPEKYRGAIILCSGADDPQVRLSIVDAVSKYTGLGANQISVLKMK